MESASTDLGQSAFRIYGSTTSGDISGSSLSGDILPKFIKRENKYYSQLMNNNANNGEGQVIGVEISGIKGFFNTVKLTNGADTEIELANVGHDVVISS